LTWFWQQTWPDILRITIDLKTEYQQVTKILIILLADFDPSTSDKEIAMNFLIHMADISNTTKEWKACQKWIDLLFVEFFYQGDLERS
jgi:hypothetical protein